MLVNPNGVDIGELAQARADAPRGWRSRLGLPEAPTDRLRRHVRTWHGVKLLPELIERVAEQREDARWVLSATARCMPRWPPRSSGAGSPSVCLLTGVVPTHAPSRCSPAATCTSHRTCPTRTARAFFGSPTKLFEYMGLGRAIVASDLDQIGEVLEDGRTALLTAPGDVPAAASAIVRLLDDEPLRARLGRPH